MKEQNAPLWRNGQMPSSGSSQSTPEQEAQQQNQKSEQHKRKH